MSCFLTQTSYNEKSNNKTQTHQKQFIEFVTEVQKLSKQSNDKLLLTFKHFQGDQLISFHKIQKLFLLNQFQIITNVTIHQNGIIKVTLNILKNAQIFRISNSIRIFDLINYLNDLNGSNKKFTVNANIHTHIIYISSCLKFSQIHLLNNASLILNYMVQQTQNIISQTMFYIYYILLVGGQLNQQFFKILTSQKYQIARYQSQKQQQILKFISLFSQVVRQGNPIYFVDKIKQFMEPEAFSICIGRTGFKIIQNLQATETKTEIKKYTKQQQNQQIKNYIGSLEQQRYKRPKQFKTQRYQNYSVVQLYKNDEQKQDTGWKVVKKQTNSQISANYSQIYFLQKTQHYKPIFFEDKIKRNLILKQCQNNVKIEQQKNAISKFGNLSSNHIARYYCVISKRNKYQNKIVMNFEKQGSSQNYLFRNRMFSLINKLKFFKQFIQGLRILQEKRIVHMDLKFANILVGQDLSTKISDFGQSFQLNHNLKANQNQQFDPNKHGFTIPYTPPQYFKQYKIDKNYDIYSYGVMLHQILTRTQSLFPCRKLKMKSILKSYLVDKKYPNLINLNIEKFQALFPSHVARLFMVIILTCLNPNSKKRINSDVISIMMSLIQGYLNKHLTI